MWRIAMLYIASPGTMLRIAMLYIASPGRMWRIAVLSIASPGRMWRIAMLYIASPGRIVAECDALYTAQENLEAAAEIFEAFVLSLMANVHPPAEDAVTGSPMAKHRKKPANSRG
jgi:hypothetical protein